MPVPLPALPLALLADVGRAVLAVAVFLGLLVLLSENRRAIPWRLVGAALGLQVAGAVLLLKVPVVTDAIGWVAAAFVTTIGFVSAGSALLFGPLLDAGTLGYVFVVQILPTIVFFSAITSILYHFGILQRIVHAFAWVMHRTMRMSGTESLAAAANIFVGQTEAPLVVKPYIAGMSRSELLCLMTGGMSTIAGGVFAAYVGMLGGDDPVARTEFARQLLVASFLSAPAAVLCAKILLPETGEIDRSLKRDDSRTTDNVFDAACEGTTQGVRLAVNVGAMLLVFTSLVALGDHVLGTGPGTWLGLNERIAAATGGVFDGLSFGFLFGVLFAPVAWLVGVDPGNLLLAGQLLGEKLVLNEFNAYATFSGMLGDGRFTGAQDIAVMTFALCGFSNFASIGIQVGGLSVLAPERRVDLSRLAPRALLAGTVACLVTAAIAQVFYR